MTAETFAKLCAAAVVLAAAPLRLHAQDLRCDRGDLEVRELEFAGNVTFPSTELANVIVTTPSGWARRHLHLPFSAKRCLNRTEFTNDRLRLILYYRRRGFPRVTVDTALAPAGPAGVRVKFTITEGPATQLGTLTILGLDSVSIRSRVLRDLPIKSGDRFDRVRIDATMDTIVHRLRNAGYPGASADNAYGVYPGPSGDLADDSITVQTGPVTRVGALNVAVTPVPGGTQQISDRVVRRLVGIDSGMLYRERILADVQRALYETDAYAYVSVALDSAQVAKTFSDTVSSAVIPLNVRLVENPMHAARLGVGYGTLDCFRATGELDDYNFLGDARRMELRGRVSKIGIGRPLDGASSLCSQARNDPYSTRLNYYLGATLRQPVLFGLRRVPTITAFTSRVSEYNAYVRTTSIGGIASVALQQTRRSSTTLSYKVDFGRTEAQPALFCAVFNLCTSEDRERVQQNQRLAVASLVYSRDRSNNAVSPSRGGIVRFEARHSSRLVLSDSGLRFNSFLGDVSRYIGLGGGTVLALRLRGGAVLGKGFIPPQERMYAGGPTTVRGFRQNELGSVTYIATAYDTVTVIDPGGGPSSLAFRVSDTTRVYRRAVPVGGNSLVVANAELRLRSPVLPELFQFAIFADAGDVWNRGQGSAFENFRLKVTPGVQAAALTPIGPIRVIVGYNPYQRSAGPLYYEATAAAGGGLPCVSPGNTLPVTETGTGQLVQAEGRCPASFRPAETRSFRSRLTFSLAIGQAF